MNISGKFLALAVAAGIASANVGPVLADDDEHGWKSKSEQDYAAGWSDDARAYSGAYSGQRGGYALLKEYGVDPRDHWKVTAADYDHQGRLSMLQHVVPLHDMATFGSVTNGIIANGLIIERVDAVFNNPDADVREPHYHFTQRFQASS